MITSRWFKEKEELKEILELRREIFGEDSDLDFYDEFSFNIGIYEDDDNLVGIGRLLSKEGKFYIDNFGVKKDFQGKYYGDFMLRILIRKAHEIGIEKLYVRCSKNVVDFFRKLDFKEEHSTGDTFFLSREGDVSSGCCG